MEGLAAAAGGTGAAGLAGTLYGRDSNRDYLPHVHICILVRVLALILV